MRERIVRPGSDRRVLLSSVTYAAVLHALCLLMAVSLGAGQEGLKTLGTVDFALYDPEGGEPGGGDGSLSMSAPPPAPAPAPPEPGDLEFDEPEEFLEEEPLRLIESVSKLVETAPPPPPPPKEEEPKRKPEARRERQRQERPREGRTQEASAGSGQATGQAADAAGSGPGGGQGPGQGGSGGGTGRGTRDPLAGYVTRVVRRLEHSKKYPQMARRDGIQGQVIVAFRVSSRGEIKAPRIAKSSGHQILDEEAMALLRRVGTLPPFPPELDRQEVSLEVPLNFTMRR
jgi:protein TonB